MSGSYGGGGHGRGGGRGYWNRGGGGGYGGRYGGDRGGRRSGGGGRGGGRDGDWVCSQSRCGYVNFARITECHICRAPSPAGGGGGGNRGGGDYNSGRSGNYGRGGRNYDGSRGGRSGSYGGRGGIGQEVKNPSLDYSHFISLPLAIHPDLVDKLQNFQNAILGCSASGQDGNMDSDSNEETPDYSDNEGKPTTHTYSNHGKLPNSVLSELGIDKSIFINPKTFHLTVLMLSLRTDDRIASATEVFQKISSQVNDALDNRPVFIALKGLECMQGSPAKACVVYAPVEEIGGEGRLLRACQVITKAYVEAGLVLEKDVRRTLKLHATLMNARHRKGMKTWRNDSFDARDIFLRYGSEKWGDYLIREAHLSQRFVYDEGGYYHCCASIPFP